MLKIGFFGSCQLCNCYNFFLNEEVRNKNFLQIKFALPFYLYDNNYQENCDYLDYSIIDDLDILIIEINKLDNKASSKKIIEYCYNKNPSIKIIKTFLIKFPIYPINWSGYGENGNDYINWSDLQLIDYNKRFEKCVESCKKNNMESDLTLDISNFIENNFAKQLLFTHSLHPTNVLLYELWKSIFKCLEINIDEFTFNFKEELILCWSNPFTEKMMKDLNIQFQTIVDDNFYIQRYNENKSNYNLFKNKIFSS